MDELLDNESVSSNARALDEPACSFWTDSCTECEKPRKKYRKNRGNKKKRKKKENVRIRNGNTEQRDTEEREDAERRVENGVNEETRNGEDHEELKEVEETAGNNAGESNEKGVDKEVLEVEDERADDVEREDNKGGEDSECSNGQKTNSNCEKSDQSWKTEKDGKFEDQIRQKTRKDRERNKRLEVTEDKRKSLDNGKPSSRYEQAVNPEKNGHGTDRSSGLQNASTVTETYDKDLGDEIVTKSHETSASADEQAKDLSIKRPQRKVQTDQKASYANFKTLPHQYKPPRDFKSLSQLTPTNKLENVIGVVTHFTPVSPCKGSDFVMKVYIMDPTFYGSTREVLFFRPDIWKFPEIYCVGDIVRFHRIKAGQYLGDIQLISNKATSCMVFPGLSEEPINLDTARYQADNPTLTMDTVRAAWQLRTWLRLNKDVICPTVVVTLSEISANSYCDTVGKVVLAAETQKPDHPMFLTIYDATTPLLETGEPMEGGGIPELHGSEETEGDYILWDVTDDLPKEKLVRVYLGSKHAKALNELQLTTGQVVLLHSAWAERDSSGHLNLFLSNDGPELNGVTFINPNSKLGEKHEFEGD